MAVEDRFTELFGATRRLEAVEEIVRQLPTGHGGGTSGGVTDDWKASVDRQLGELHNDVRALWKSGLAATFVLAGMIAGLYLYTNEKFEAIHAEISTVREQQVKASGDAATRDAVTNGKLDVLLERKSAKSSR